MFPSRRNDSRGAFPGLPSSRSSRSSRPAALAAEDSATTTPARGHVVDLDEGADPLSALVARYATGLYRLAVTLTGDRAFSTNLTSDLLKAASTAHVPPGEVELYSRAIDACRAEKVKSPLFPDLSTEQREALALAEGAQLDLEVIAEVIGIDNARCQRALSVALRQAIPRRGHASSAPRMRRATAGGRR
ncbi:MAG: hypothetical protein U0165_11245 [Polyangiaceae bacterium]